MTEMAEKRDATGARAYLLRGDDEFQKRQALDELLKSLVAEEFADFDLEEIEAAAATCDRVITGLNVPPFGPGRRVVLVRFANKMDAEQQERLAARLEKAPATGCLVMVNPAVERSDGRPKKGSELIGELSKAIRKVGQVREFGGGTGKERAKRAREFGASLFEPAGKKISAEALALFLQRAGADFGILATEAQKLVDYVGDEAQITRADVEAVTSETPEEKVFKMVDAVAAKNAGAALRLLDELFETGDDPRADAPRSLANLARQFRLIWQAKILTEAGLRTTGHRGGDGFQKSAVPAELKSVLPSSPNLLEVPGWQQSRAAEKGAKLPRAELVRCFAAVAKADAMLKGVEGEIEDARTVMELLVIELAGGRY